MDGWSTDVAVTSIFSIFSETTLLALRSSVGFLVREVEGLKVEEQGLKVQEQGLEEIV